MYDVTIIGAGPAGATLARLIGGRFKVLLLDKRPLSAQPESPASGKCCGGLLAPDAQAMLARLGLGLPGGVLDGPQLFAVRALCLASGLERYYQRHYINMDRRRLDLWLLSLVPEYVEIRTGIRFRKARREGWGFSIDISDGDRVYREETRVLVGADGAAGPVRSLIGGPRPRPRQYVAIQEWIEAASPPPFFSSIFDPEITDFYAWTIPKKDHVLLGAALPPGADAPARFARLKARLETRGLPPGRVLRREGCYLLRPDRAGAPSTGGPGVALIGESGGWISPSSAEGLSYAFQSAVRLAEAMGPGLHGFERRYARKMAPMRMNIRMKNLKSKIIYDPAFRRAVMRMGIGSVRVL